MSTFSRLTKVRFSSWWQRNSTGRILGRPRRQVAPHRGLERQTARVRRSHRPLDSAACHAAASSKLQFRAAGRFTAALWKMLWKCSGTSVGVSLRTHEDKVRKCVGLLHLCSLPASHSAIGRCNRRGLGIAMAAFAVGGFST